MKTKIYQLTAIVMLVALMTQCKKDPSMGRTSYDQLPPITSEGLETFGCLKNGKLWQPSGSQPKSRSAYYDQSTEEGTKGYLSMVAKNQYFDKAESVTFHKTDIMDTGMYRLRYTKHLVPQDNNYDNGYIYISPNIMYDSDSSSYGWVHIHHLDKANRIISGTFEYDVINTKDKTDTIKIRKGRFDHKY